MASKIAKSVIAESITITAIKKSAKSCSLDIFKNFFTLSKGRAVMICKV